jgi:hypothetical protein
MEIGIIKQFERECFLVWKVLDRVRQSVPAAALLHAEITQAERTLLSLMQAAECIDPTIPLDGTREPSPVQRIW